MPKVSIILPVYNVEEYIRECLDSVIKQTLHDIEIICVNDGSTDNSRKILQEYADNDSRIKVIDQKNSGQGNARNIGIEIATGEYLGFVDPDDYCDYNMYEKLYNNAKRFDSDLVESNYMEYNDTTKKMQIQGFNIELPDNKMFNIYINKDYLFCGNFSCWNKLYKLAFIKSNNIKFANSKCAEDHIFVIKSRVLAKKISFYNYPLYIYRIRKGSSFYKLTSETLKRVALHKEIKKFLIDSNIYPFVIDSYNLYLIYSLAYTYERVPIKNRKLYEKQVLEFVTKEQYSKYERLISDKDKFIEKIFSLKNTYKLGIKYKMITLLGFKIKLKCVG